jgi:outer membrane lipoprotein-sorting protein
MIASWTTTLILVASAVSSLSVAEQRRANDLSLPVPEFIVSYRAEFHRRAGSDIEQGVLYFKGPSSWRLELITPIRQTLAGTDSTLLVYYPDEGRAVKISLSMPTAPPSHFNSIFLRDPPVVLESAHFGLTGFWSEGDTMITRWDRKLPEGNPICVELRTVQGCTAIIEWLDGSTILKRIMLSYSLDQPDCLITEIVELAGADTVTTRYLNSAFGVSLDDALFVPSLPPGTSVKEHKW